MTRRSLHLGLFMYPGGHHIAGWRHPSAPAQTYTSLDYYREAAQLAERGRFDIFFVGDTLATRNKGRTFFGRQAIPNLDPVSLCAAVSGVTERIGVVATLSTTYHQPDYVALKFATLDHVTGGRAGWNIVTTFDPAAAFNFGRERLLEKSERYARGQQFVEAVTALWDGWGEGALVGDRAGGRFVDPSRVMEADLGQFGFVASGPLRVPRPPQGWPVLVQAGGSPQGRDLAARFAEVIFAAQPDLGEAKAFRANLHALMAGYDRRPEDLAIMPGLSPIVASTEAEARRKEQELDELVHPEVGAWMLAKTFPFDFSACDPHEPLPVAALRALPKSTQNNETLLSAAERESMTVLDAARWLARSRSHQTYVGTPEGLADSMQQWIEEGGCDGFNLMPSHFPDELAVFVDQVVPILQGRGLLRRDYAGRTLRDHLGLRRPATPRTAVG
jgi:FMN-dependent oxidoreductase (nitrilotriacetate monooxygenase family)